MSNLTYRLATTLAFGALTTFGCTDNQSDADGAGGSSSTDAGSGGTVTTGGSGGSGLPGSGGQESSGGSGGGSNSGGSSTGGLTNTGGAGGGDAAGGSTSAGGGNNPGVGGSGNGDVLADVVVQAGALDRDHTLVSFQYPSGQGQVLALQDADGVELPLQIDESGVATFVLPSLTAGAEASFALVQPAVVPSAGATATEVDGVVRLSVGSATVADFRVTDATPSGVSGNDLRAGYLHPIRTPSGTVVTDDYPADHVWDHGIWTAWTQVEVSGQTVDFWNSYKNEGRVDLESLTGTWHGPVHAGLDAELIHVNLLGGSSTALNERWLVRAYNTHAAPAPYLVFDLESTQTNPNEAAFNLLEYTYGGFAFRGHAEWTTPANVSYLTSEGHDRIAGEDQPARWCFMGGNVAGSPVGFAALGHPDNFRAPQTMRLHPTDPFMVFSPVKDGAFSIESGTPYVSRYRIVTVDGPVDATLLDRLWNDYATPPVATVTPR